MIQTMQLFILDHDPAIAAQMLADTHLRKMCLENAQILSAVIINKGLDLPDALPKAYNPAHPVIQAVNTPFKINWVLAHNEALHREYRRRFNKTHAYSKWCGIYKTLLYSTSPGIAELSFARVFKDFATDTTDIVQAYREYYRFKKSIIRNWHYTNTYEPEWLGSSITEAEVRRCGQTEPEKYRNSL